MSVTGILSGTGMQVSTAAITAIEAQLNATHEVVNVVASAIMPPTNDSASAQAMVQQLTNVEGFAMSLRAGLFELRKVADLTAATNVATALTEAGSAAAVATV
jgi:hypothetical protein